MRAQAAQEPTRRMASSGHCHWPGARDSSRLLSSSCLSVRRPRQSECCRAENSIPGPRGTALAAGRTVALFVTFARYHGGRTQGAYHLYLGQTRSSGICPR
jgi:hypothetical protein